MLSCLTMLDYKFIRDNLPAIKKNIADRFMKAGRLGFYARVLRTGAVRAGEEKIVRSPGKVEVFGTLIRSHITPEIIEVEKGDEVTINLTNLERAEDETHGFTISTMNVHASIEPGKTVSLKFKAEREGVFPYYCTEFCSALHLEMAGYLLVEPAGGAAAPAPAQ